MSNINYEELTEKFKGTEKKFNENCEEAKYHYEKLLHSNFEKMRESIKEIVKDIPAEDFRKWLEKAEKDDNIDYKMYTLIVTCWIDTHDTSFRGLGILNLLSMFNNVIILEDK